MSSGTTYYALRLIYDTFFLTVNKYKLHNKKNTYLMVSVFFMARCTDLDIGVKTIRHIGI